MPRDIRPDASPISFDAATFSEVFEDLPPELQEAFSSIYTDKIQQEAKAYQEEQLRYQEEQASTLLDYSEKLHDWSERWEEVDTEAGEGRLIDELAIDRQLEDAGMVPLDWGGSSHPSMKQELLELDLLDQRPTLHQFYRDLYSFSMTSGTDGKYFVISDWDFDNDQEIITDLTDDAVSILVNHREREHPYQLYSNYWEFIEGVKPETSFIYMGSFWVPPNGFLTARRNAMKTIGGFCVDIDRAEGEDGKYFAADWVIRTLLDLLEETPELKPNYIMLSGTGIQLWYVFGDQIPLLSKTAPRRKKYGDLLQLLYRWFDENLPKNRFKVDVPCATINHAFRAPGSPSKHHYPTRLFARGGRFRKKINPLELSHFLGGELKPYDLEDWDQEEYELIKKEAKAQNWKKEPATDKQRAYLEKLKKWGCIEKVPSRLGKGRADELIKQAEIVATKRIQFKETGGYIETTEGHRIKRKKRNEKLYYSTLERMQKETPAGSRYNAMFGLAGLAWNCGVPKSQLEQHLMELLGTDWAKKPGPTDGRPLDRDDVRAAVKGWHPLGALRKREQLEHRLQWHYNPPAKRNNRKREEHLEFIARPMIEQYRKLGETEHLPGRPTKRDEIRRYAKEHPEASHSEIARALGVSRPTVIKWLKITEE